MLLLWFELIKQILCNTDGVIKNQTILICFDFCCATTLALIFGISFIIHLNHAFALANTNVSSQFILRLWSEHCKATTEGRRIHRDYCGTMAEARGSGTVKITFKIINDFKIVDKSVTAKTSYYKEEHLPDTRITHTVSMIAVCLQFHENGTLRGDQAYL